jgi:hypothetical protein
VPPRFAPARRACLKVLHGDRLHFAQTVRCMSSDRKSVHTAPVHREPRGTAVVHRVSTCKQKNTAAGCTSTHWINKCQHNLSQTHDHQTAQLMAVFFNACHCFNSFIRWHNHSVQCIHHGFTILNPLPFGSSQPEVPPLHTTQSFHAQNAFWAMHNRTGSTLSTNAQWWPHQHCAERHMQ